MTRVVVTNQVFDQTNAAAVAGAQIVFNNFAPITRKAMAGLPEDAVVIRYGVGIDNLDLGARVCNVPDYGVNEVADHAAAMAVFLACKIHSFDDAIQRGDWEITQIVNGLRSLSETTVGLVGFGRIAQEFAKRMQAFGCTVIAYDPFVDPAVAKAAGVTLATSDEVIAQTHILSLHTPLADQKRELTGARELAALPAQAIVINASRGWLIDEEALAQALTAGQVAAAGPDVFEQEPLPESSPLRQAPNLHLSPHAALYSDTSVRRLQQLAAEEAGRALRGVHLRCPIVGA